jgi:cytoplasmic iron level regulating protein YaaA (DUF328/UPF0246 family)
MLKKELICTVKCLYTAIFEDQSHFLGCQNLMFSVLYHLVQASDKVNKYEYKWFTTIVKEPEKSDTHYYHYSVSVILQSEYLLEYISG